MEEKLVPCPFCGSTKLKVWDNAVCCEECDSSGPNLGHCTGPRCRAEAIEKWNNSSLTLLSAAEAFITEAESMGWGERSEAALPGAWDNLKLAVERAKG